jgi:biotin transporter BioY
MDLTKACLAMLVFLPGDLLKALVAAVVAQRIRRLNMV